VKKNPVGQWDVGGKTSVTVKPILAFDIKKSQAVTKKGGKGLGGVVGAHLAQKQEERKFQEEEKVNKNGATKGGEKLKRGGLKVEWVVNYPSAIFPATGKRGPTYRRVRAKDDQKGGGVFPEQQGWGGGVV